MSHLELQLALPLFTRGRGRLNLTPEGSALLAEVERHFIGLNSIEAAAARIAAHGVGNLRLIAFPSMSSGPLPRAVAAHLTEHPDTTITLDTDTTDKIASRVESGAYDVGFTVGHTNIGHAVNARVIASRPWVCVFRSDHHLSTQKQISMDELVSEALIGFSPGMSLRDRIDLLFSVQGHAPNFSLCAQTIESICGLVEAGCGAAVVHPYATHVAQSRGLVTIPLTQASTLDLIVLTPKLSTIAQKTLDFINLLKSNFAPS